MSYPPPLRLRLWQEAGKRCAPKNIFFVLKERLNEWKQDLVKEKNRLDLEREQLKEDRASLRADEQQLESLALNVKQRSQEISDITNVRAASIHLSCNRHSPGYGLPLFFSLFFV